ncbi:MAG: L-histidine N(alpha)-methyltransferase [Caulobacterales bacterium]|nr:L-histidine N(alpha)-methyltransferase [Caulobacterales bacterium]
MTATETRSAVARPHQLDFVVDLSPPAGDFLADVIAGLSEPQKSLPPKYLYDERGSELFDAICDTADYYVTRTETGILRDIAGKAALFAGPGAAIIEIGAGATVKVRTLLDAMDAPEIVVALDISQEFLVEACMSLAAAYPDVRVGAICADFTDTVRLPNGALDGAGRRLAFFPGSTIGNFEPGVADAILRTLRRLLRPGDGLLIGADLIKEPAILEAAYDDSEGVTAAFEHNILVRINRELGADIDTEAFGYRASWNRERERVDMHLVSLRPQSFTIAGHSFALAEGETIHTESSHKFSIAGFQAKAERAGFAAREAWTDDAGLFSVHLLEAV